jgi:thioesterase domain-containing protein
MRMSLDALRAPREKFPKLARRTARRLAPRLPIAPPDDDGVELPPLIHALQQTNADAFDAYVPALYPGRAIFFRANERDPHMCDPLPIWSRVVSRGLTVECVPGDHLAMLEEPFVAEVAARLAVHLGDGRSA